MQRGALEERPHQFMGIPRQRVGPEMGCYYNTCPRHRGFYHSPLYSPELGRPELLAHHETPAPGSL